MDYLGGKGRALYASSSLAARTNLTIRRNNMIIYLLSIMDRVSTVVFSFFMATVTVMALCLIIGAVAGSIGAEENDEGAKRTGKTMLGYAFKWMLPMVIVFSVLTALVPTKRDVIISYVMVEGNKIATAENAEALMKDVGGKVDGFIKALNGELSKEASANGRGCDCKSK
jgi:hypothetical protein